MIYRITGTLKWTEERLVDCRTSIDDLFEANSEDEAIQLAVKAIDYHADTETTVATTRQGKGSVSQLAVTLVEPNNPTNDPTTRDMLDKLHQKDDRINLDYMRAFSTPLFDNTDVEIV